MERYKEWLISAGIFLSTTVAPALGQAPDGEPEEQEVQQEIELEEKEEEVLEKPVKFHVAQEEGYSKQGFELAEEYLEEEVGLDVEFMFHGRDLPGYVDLDHIRNFAIKDITTDERIEMLLENTKMPEENPNIDTDEEFQEEIMRAMNHYSTSTGAEAHPQDSTIYLLGEEDEGRDLSLPEKILKLGKEGRDPYEVKKEALKLVHEIGHLAGLYHPTDFPNTKIPKEVDGRTNVMCRLLPPSLGGKYGFDLTEEQLETVESYFSKGKQFQIFKENNFNTFSYLDHVEESEGYQERGEGTIEKLKGD